jgi:hypothetical protein
MKRIAFVLTLCVLTSILGGGDFMNYIWQHVVGHGYDQVSMDGIQSAEISMSAAVVVSGSLGQNSVLLYKTRHGYYGKLAVISLSGSSLELQFTTFDTTGQALARRDHLAIGPGEYCDLESAGTDASATTGNFLWTGGALVPQGQPPAKFYLLP